MANTQTRGSGLFSGLVLLTVGILLLLHNYHRLELADFFSRWWPLLIIFWGAVKLYERTAGRRFGGSGGAITGGEVFLVIGMLALLGVLVAVDITKNKVSEAFGSGIISGDKYDFDLDVEPKTIAAKAPVLIRTTQGDITVRASDDAELHVSGKKNVRTWSETEASRVAQPIGVEVSQSGNGYDVHPSGFNPSNGRISVDIDVQVPKRSPLSVKTELGDVTISDMASTLAIFDKQGDIDVHGVDGGVTLEMRKGDAKVVDTKGDVKVTGKGGEIGIEVDDATGSLTVDGDFYGSVRAARVSKGVRLSTAKTALTVTSLDGHLEAGSGSLELVDAHGSVDLRTRDVEVDVENPGGKVNIDNRNAQTTVRFSSAPKDDIQITNSSAGISLTLPGSASFEIQADCRNCDIESEFSSLSNSKNESGDSHLAGKVGSGKGPKITLKTSYGNIELHRSSVTIPAPPKVAAPSAPPAPPHEIPPSSEE
jgi:hypothetical protein